MDKTKIFDDLIKNFQLIIDELKDGEEFCKSEEECFDMQTFWNNLNAGMQAMSSAATKLCFAFSPTPLTSVEETRPLLSDVERSALAIVSAYYTLPLSQGKALHCVVSSSVLGIVTAAQSLVQSISLQLCERDNTSESDGQKKSKKKGTSKHLQMTGLTWDYADKFTDLPADNGQAVSLRAKEYHGLVSDALHEIEQALAENDEANDEILDDDDDDMMTSHHWSDADREVAKACTQLLKAAKACAKKVTVLAPLSGDSCDTAAGAAVGAEAVRMKEEISAVDDVSEQLSAVSPAVDDLIESLYPPLTLSAVSLNCERLSETIQRTLVSIRTLLDTRTGAQTENKKWVEFIEKAVNHNKQKISTLINSMQPIS